VFAVKKVCKRFQHPRRGERGIMNYELGRREKGAGRRERKS
jgi:hypothetical protein